MSRIMQCKAQIQTKADDSSLADGEFKAVVAVFGNKDTYGDVIVKGAFAKSLQEWNDGGDSIPIVWSHDWSNPFAHIGMVKHAEETDRGLEITGIIPAEDLADNPTAAQVHRLLKSRRITQFSFAYDVVEGAEVKHDGDYAFELRELKVHEVGPCLLGVNQSTELLAAKSALAKGASRSDLEAARDSINRVLQSLDDPAAPDDEDTPDPDEDSSDDEQPVEHDPSATDTPASAGQQSEPKGLTYAQRLELLELELRL